MYRPRLFEVAERRSFFYQRRQFGMCQAPRGRSSAISTDFGSAMVNIWLKLVTEPPWLPVGVGFVMLLGFPTRSDPVRFLSLRYWLHWDFP